MAPKRSQVPAARLIGLAVLLVLSGTVPAIDAQSTGFAATVFGGPYFDPAIPARGTCTANAVLMARPAGNETQVRTIDVSVPVAGVTRVELRYTLGAAGVGTPTNPGLAKALTWNDTLAGGAGWTAVADNRGNQTGQVRTLTFLAQPGTAINPGGPARLTFGFEIPRTAAAGDSFRVSMLLSAPDTSGSGGFCIRIDTTPPTMKSAVTRDTDYDGRIDMMELTFDEDLDSDSLLHAAFDVRDPSGARSYAVLGTSPPLVDEQGPPNDCHLEPAFDIWLYPCPRRVILKLAPGPTFDTGILPSVRYPAPGWNATLTDLAGNRLADIGAGALNSTDGAKPVMVSALAKEGSNSIVVTFSEPVRGTGTAGSNGIRPVRIDSDDPAQCASNCGADFVYFEALCHPTPATVPATPTCASDPCAPPAPSSSTCVGDGDCLGGFDQTGRGMAPQMRGPALHDPLGPTANQVTILIGGGDGAHPWRYPKAWNLPDASLTGHGTAITPFPPPPGTRGCTNGQLGAGDTHKTKGDNLGLRPEAVPPTNCLDNSRKIYDFDARNAPPGFQTLVDPDWTDTAATLSVTCDRTIKDAAGLRAIAYKRAPRLVITGPFVTEAEVNIDSFKLSLKFNGPVTSAAGNTIGIQLNDISIVTTDCAGQGPTGVVAINHTAGSDEAIVTLDHRTRPCDLDDTPSRVRLSAVAGRGVKAFGQNMLVPSFDPDADSHPDVDMVDRTNPAFTPPNAYTPALSTVDANRNGYIDGIKVYFSEPIDDSSFCLGPQAALPPQVCAGDGFFDNGAQGRPRCSQPNTHSILIVNNIPGPYTWDTDLLPDDNEGIIRFPETPGRLQTTGHTPAISTNECWTKDGYSNPEVNPCDVSCRRGMGLFTDQFRPSPQSNPPYLAANYMKRVCGDSFGRSILPLCTEANGITAKVFDGAPPALWGARTLDTPVPGQFCNASTTTGCEGDGLLDGYLLAFSEPVNDCSFKAAEWKVAGHTVLGMRTSVPLDKPRHICPSPKYPPQGQGNDNLVLLINAGSVPDTDARPDITYAGPSCNSCGMRDLNGNSMAAFGSLAVDEKDDAAPVIFCARGFVGQNTVTLEFSEPVDDGNKGGIVSGDLLYGNRNQFRSDGASGFSSTQGTVHQPGSRTATLTLNGALTNQDIANDTVSAVFHAIVERTSDENRVGPLKPVSTVAHKLLEQSTVRNCRGIDTTAPSNVTNLQVVTGLTSANAVTLSWTAPGNDATEHGNVTNYRIKVSTQRITPADVASPTSPGTVAILATNHARDPLSCPATNGTTAPGCAPACLNQVIVATQGVAFGNLNLRTDPSPCELAQPGQVQRATIVGLDPDTTYHFAVVALDNATTPNASGMGTSVSAKTGVDATPPSPAPVIFSSIPPFRSSPERRPQFQWSNATDPQSTVTYAVAINHRPDYTVRCATPETPVAGGPSNVGNVGTATTWRPDRPLESDTTEPWTFHVAACSAGGQTATAHYTIIVGAARIDPQRIENANSLIETRPYRLGDEYRVNWTLPPEAAIRQWVPSGEVVGVQIWRLFCPEGGSCSREFAAQIPGNYSELRGPREWIDNQTGFAVEPYYRVEMVFSGGQTQDTGAEKVQGFAAPVDRTERSSALIPLLILILVAAVCAALVAWAILASRKRAAVRQVKEESPAGVDPETGLPTHDVKCPTCQTPFQAVGTLPLQITCPNCGAAGILQ